LPEELKEVSGIVKLGGDSLLAIEDLHASLYFLKLGDSNRFDTHHFAFCEQSKR
jgi:hypothetical protein